MTSDELVRLIEDCRRQAEQIDAARSFRLRTLLQMILVELEKERAARQVQDSPP